MVVLGEIKERADAERVAEDLLHALAAPHVADRRPIPLSASIGIALYPDDGKAAAELWAVADTFMYKAKQAGGNRYQFSELVEREATEEKR